MEFFWVKDNKILMVVGEIDIITKSCNSHVSVKSILCAYFFQFFYDFYLSNLLNNNSTTFLTFKKICETKLFKIKF